MRVWDHVRHRYVHFFQQHLATFILIGINLSTNRDVVWSDHVAVILTNQNWIFWHFDDIDNGWRTSGEIVRFCKLYNLHACQACIREGFKNPRHVGGVPPPPPPGPPRTRFFRKVSGKKLTEKGGSPPPPPRTIRFGKRKFFRRKRRFLPKKHRFWANF